MSESDFKPNQTSTNQNSANQNSATSDAKQKVERTAKKPQRDASPDTGTSSANSENTSIETIFTPKILIAEDEYLIAASIRDALMRYGEPLNVVVVQRSNMLVDNISNLKPDVLLMDISLKGAMDGIEAIQHIKSTGRDIPVIYITADSRITTLERAETTKPVAYLIKPFREADLHKALAKALALLED